MKLKEKVFCFVYGFALFFFPIPGTEVEICSSRERKASGHTKVLFHLVSVTLFLDSFPLLFEIVVLGHEGKRFMFCIRTLWLLIHLSVPPPSLLAQRVSFLRG